MEKHMTLGFAITGSFCTFKKILVVMQNLVDEGYKLIPIFSFNAATQDTMFYEAAKFKKEVEEITGEKIVETLQDAEPLGPSGKIEVMVVAPCTGNTLAKIANAITDTPVTMSVKAHLRNNNPIVIAISTNDALGLNLKNIGTLMSTKNIFLVPYSQDNFEGKPNSLVADFNMIKDTVEMAKLGRQIQPVIKI